MQKDRYASIDIGTNTLRLLVAEVDNMRLKPLIVKRIITRLGGDFKEDVGIAESSMQRAADALKIFADIAKEHNVKEIFADATSVVRRAKNRARFIQRVFDETGIKINVISGDEEAGLALLGVLSVIKNKDQKCLVIDIGGGSTEFIVVENNKMLSSWSMKMGVVHLTEKYLKSDPPTRNELNAMEDKIDVVIAELKSLMKKGGCLLEIFNPVQSQYLTPHFPLPTSHFPFLVGTAGTITTLAAIDSNLETYAPEKINNYVLEYDAVKRIYNHLSSIPLKERQKILSLEKGREDLIIPGAAIVLKTMDAFEFDSITVSDAGLLEGILLKQLQVTSRAGL